MTPLDPVGLVVGIDIGGTKTHLRAEAGDAPARDSVVPTADWRRRDWGEDASQLLRMVGELAGGAPVAAIGVGAHGCDDADECDAFQSAFVARTATPVAVVNDSELMPLTMGLPGQIGLVAGTGSIAVCRTNGTMLVAGGWGWIIGDDGSAAGLVRDAARAVAGYLDRGGVRDEPLTERLFEALSIPSAARIGTSLSALGGAAGVGRHAAIVFDAAAQGSALAHEVIRSGGAALADLVRTLQRRGASATDVVAGGSVIAAQPLLWQAFTAGLADVEGGRITPHLFAGQPVEGACRLAAALARSTGSTGSAVRAAPHHV